MTHKLGLIHRDTPLSVIRFGAVAPMHAFDAPPSVDWHAKCPADGDALGNHEYGDCLPVAQLRAIQMRRAVAWGDSWKPTRDMALGLYGHLTGFDPATGQPDGGSEVDNAMLDWSQHGIRTDSQNEDVPIWVSVNRRSFLQIRAAIAHFGPVQLSVALPYGIENDPTRPWVMPTNHAAPEWVPASWGYHRIMCGKYDQDSFTVRTWGVDVQVDLSFFLSYFVAVDATISRQWLDATGLNPMGTNYADLASMADDFRNA